MSLAQIIHKHLSALLEDLDDWRPPSDQSKALVMEAIEMATDVRDSLAKYIETGERDSGALDRDLIKAAMYFVQRWDAWLKRLRHPYPRYSCTKTFHEYLLRYAKGAVKHWRGWRVDMRK